MAVQVCEYVRWHGWEVCTEVDEDVRQQVSRQAAGDEQQVEQADASRKENKGGGLKQKSGNRGGANVLRDGQH